ncbi:hypothetical protein N665_0194s0009 [Sinapis alba]|nr:hypothetical protein N665_0194s0009 [Sinapis alba]
MIGKEMFQKEQDGCFGIVNAAGGQVMHVILVYYKDLESHQGPLKTLRKCRLWQRSIEFFGHIVSNQGVLVDPEKIKSIKEWPRPKNATEVRSFPGLDGYYKNFVKEFARVAQPMT